MSKDWLTWAKALQALSQTGLAYTKDPFDQERFEAIRTIAAEIVAAQTSIPLQKIETLFQSQAGYATPKVDVRGVVFNKEKILLVREKSDGLWTLPGGWADTDASPKENVEREIYEESGYRTKAAKLLAVYERNKHPHPPQFFNTYKLFFHCELIGGSPTDSIETEEASFFAEDKLPPLSLQRVLPEQISRMFDHYRHPNWPTDFD